jgi:pyridoxamine 5'-phosphate oxidase
MVRSEQKSQLRRNSMEPDPVKQLMSWLQDAELAKIAQPNAMTLATANGQNMPSARIVLLRGIDDRGFVFFTNYESRKAQDLRENPIATLLFFWRPLSRQIRVEGRVELLGADESDAYFAKRPWGHQIGAHISPQSQVIQDRAYLDGQFQEMARMFEGKAVPRPRNWGGYRVVPKMVEFWQEGENRLHDRLRYRLDERENWIIERLAP